jgi:carboxypeptidase Taq
MSPTGRNGASDSPPAYEELRRRLGEVHDIGQASAVLHWDQETMMPPGGAAARAEQLATLQGLAHERFTSDEIGGLLEGLRPYEESLDPDSDEACLIRVTRRDWEKAHRVPTELAAEIARAASLGRQAWGSARAESDFAAFAPFLERNLELKLRYIECFPKADHPYDVLLDDYEPGATTAEVSRTFDRLKEGLVPLIAAIAERSDRVDDGPLQGDFPEDVQRRVLLDLLERLGYDRERWRLDPSLHPFSTSFATTDLRITTRYHRDLIGSALFSGMHEFGHGLYEASVDPALERSPLASGCSLGLHESQSRTWENLVGRSRPFWRYFYPTLREAFPATLGGVDEEAFYRAVNKVQPSLIRVEADEATYNLHVILRFELEQLLVEGRLDVAGLPEAWNARVKDYLGLDVPDDARGVLQDVHWSGGAFGYFPTYALGNVIAAQIWEAIRADMPDIHDRIEAGDFASLREWLRDHLHRHGRKFTPADTLTRVAGGPLDTEPLLVYLQSKFGELYGLE